MLNKLKYYAHLIAHRLYVELLWFKLDYQRRQAEAKQDAELFINRRFYK